MVLRYPKSRRLLTQVAAFLHPHGGGKRTPHLPGRGTHDKTAPSPDAHTGRCGYRAAAPATAGGAAIGEVCQPTQKMARSDPRTARGSPAGAKIDTRRRPLCGGLSAASRGCALVRAPPKDIERIAAPAVRTVGAVFCSPRAGRVLCWHASGVRLW